MKRDGETSSVKSQQPFHREKGACDGTISKMARRRRVSLFYWKK